VYYPSPPVCSNVGDAFCSKFSEAAKLSPGEWTPPEVSEEESEESKEESVEESSETGSQAASRAPAPAEEQGMNPIWFVLIAGVVVSVTVALLLVFKKK